MAETTRLRVRVRQDEATKRTVEVLDPAGNVLGELASTTSEIRYRATGSDLAILSLDIPVERAAIDSLEIPDWNLEREPADVAGEPADVAEGRG